MCGVIKNRDLFLLGIVLTEIVQDKITLKIPEISSREALLAFKKTLKKEYRG